MADVDVEIKEMYGQLIDYLITKQAYYANSGSPDSEFNDHNIFDLTNAVYTIQRQIKSLPSIGEAATIKGYRDLRSSIAEYEMRLQTRASYWEDAAAEEADNILKWKNNQTLAELHMSGIDAGVVK